MTEESLRERVIEEVKLLPDDRLASLYDFVHFFRIGVEKSLLPASDQVMSFAGAWHDMPEDAFAGFLGDVYARRQSAFTERRKREASSD